MFSVSNMHRRQAEKHQLSNAVQLQSFLFGRQWTDRVCLPLPLHLSLLFLNTFPFFYIPTSLFRKSEMQEHIVTAGCFHLLLHLWHRQEWPTSALQLELGDLPPWTKIFFSLQIMEVADKLKEILIKNHLFTVQFQIIEAFGGRSPAFSFSVQ